MNIKKGDTVKIISGKDKGKKGKVIAAFPKEGKISVENANVMKKHISPEKQKQQQKGKKTGQIVEFPAAFDASNAMIVCNKCNKATRVGKSEKKRICKKCNKEI